MILSKTDTFTWVLNPTPFPKSRNYPGDYPFSHTSAIIPHSWIISRGQTNMFLILCTINKTKQNKPSLYPLYPCPYPATASFLPSLSKQSPLKSCLHWPSPLPQLQSLQPSLIRLCSPALVMRSVMTSILPKPQTNSLAWLLYFPAAPDTGDRASLNAVLLLNSTPPHSPGFPSHLSGGPSALLQIPPHHHPQ